MLYTLPVKNMPKRGLSLF